MIILEDLPTVFGYSMEQLLANKIHALHWRKLHMQVNAASWHPEFVVH